MTNYTYDAKFTTVECKTVKCNFPLNEAKTIDENDIALSCNIELKIKT